MGILSSIFGSPKNTETIVNGAVGGLDKMFFTKEEKSEANQKLSEWYLKYLEATQPQNLARRLIAMIVVGLWAVLILFGVGIRWLNIDYSDHVYEVIKDLVLPSFLLIIGFYFLAHTVRAYQSGKK